MVQQPHLGLYIVKSDLKSSHHMLRPYGLYVQQLISLASNYLVLALNLQYLQVVLQQLRERRLHGLPPDVQQPHMGLYIVKSDLKSSRHMLRPLGLYVQQPTSLAST